jgi:hypothetical protein
MPTMPAFRRNFNSGTGAEALNDDRLQDPRYGDSNSVGLPAVSNTRGFSLTINGNTGTAQVQPNADITATVYGTPGHRVQILYYSKSVSGTANGGTYTVGAAGNVSAVVPYPLGITDLTSGLMFWAIDLATSTQSNVITVSARSGGTPSQDINVTFPGSTDPFGDSVPASYQFASRPGNATGPPAVIIRRDSIPADGLVSPALRFIRANGQFISGAVATPKYAPNGRQYGRGDDDEQSCYTNGCYDQ